MSPRKPQNSRSPGFLRTEVPALLILLFTFLLFFKEWRHPFTQVFLSLDTSVLYYPVYHWVHDHIPQDQLPLICDLSMHGAPVAAVSMAGVLSPFLWLFHFISSYNFLFNVLFLLPHFLYLFGAYFLGRRLKLSPSASVLLAVVWTYNGHQMAQLDHLNVAWAHAFFPWAFNALLKYLETRRTLWLLASSLFLGLNVLSGHPQVVLLESLFFLFWALLSDGSQWRPRLTAVAWMGLGGLVVASPLILFTAECLNGNSHLQWTDVDRFYHSWTPLNFITLVFPWFFGRETFDRAGVDYWWQYQFVEMQAAFSIVALFFILLFFLQKGPHRRWIGWTALFAILMAMGKFFILYSPIQSLPLFNFFRDPARYWFLATWVLGLGAAYAWDGWFKDEKLELPGRKLGLTLAGLVVGFLLLGGFLVTLGRPVLMDLGQSFIRHFLMGDPLHTQSLAAYLARLPEKLDAIAANLNIHRARVWLPVFFTAALVVSVLNRKRWNIHCQKCLLLALVVVDLFFFRMPLGHAFYDPSKIPGPAYPAPGNRSLTLLTKNVSPLPNQYGEMAFPNWNLISGRPNLVFDANPMLANYSEIYKKLGWFSWVYKDRDPVGFSKDTYLLQILGIDQIVSDTPLKLPDDLKVVRDSYPYVYHLNIFPKAYSFPETEAGKWVIPERKVDIQSWGETRLFLSAKSDPSSFLVVQKTLLPGWRAWIDGQLTPITPYGSVLMKLLMGPGEHAVVFGFSPTSLRLGFFLLFLFLGLFSFHFLRRLVMP